MVFCDTELLKSIVHGWEAEDGRALGESFLFHLAVHVFSSEKFLLTYFINDFSTLFSLISLEKTSNT